MIDSPCADFGIGSCICVIVLNLSIVAVELRYNINTSRSVS